MSISKCPEEVLIKISAELDFDDVANLRLVNKHFAEIGAETLIRRVRFHCATDSFTRLSTIAQHDVLCKYVDSVVFEANMLANISCIHSYEHYYPNETHHHSRPPALTRGSTARDKRAWDRGMKKYNNEKKHKFKRYVELYDQQQALIGSTAYTDHIDFSMVNFPRLESITVNNLGRCTHMLSKRFFESYDLVCPVSVDIDTNYTKEQLKHLLFPLGRTLPNVRKLKVCVLSPKFFGGFVPGNLVTEAFRNLKVVDLHFRVEKADKIAQTQSTADRFYTDLNKGILRDALQAANNLEKLTINFDDAEYHGPATSLDKLLGDKSWPVLSRLNLDCLSATEDGLVETLKRQPALRDLYLGEMTLTKGAWPAASRCMKKDLKLECFTAAGFFEDPSQMYPLYHIDGQAYADDYVVISMGEALSMWITDGCDPDDDDFYHPLTDVDFESEEDLRDEYGPFADADEDDSDMDLDSD